MDASTRRRKKVESAGVRMTVSAAQNSRMKLRFSDYRIVIGKTMKPARPFCLADEVR